MKKTELKVGEEYAVFGSPGAVRRHMNSNYYGGVDQPMRVKLLAIDAVEDWYERGSYSSYWSASRTRGHKVSLPTNSGDHFSGKVMRITLSKSVLSGGVPDDLSNLEDLVGYAGGKTNTLQADWTRTFLMLENAGCFVSTWAEYERKVAEYKAMKARHADERAAKERKADADAPEKAARLERVLAKLAQTGDVKERNGYRRDDKPTSVTVEAFGGFKIEGEYRYTEGVEDDVLNGVKFTMNLDTLAQLLEVM